jgi:hypothetical protein
VPAGGDAYIMNNSLHAWNDEQCVKILENCRAPMNEKGRVLVVDTVTPPGSDPNWGKLLDIQLVIIGGRERTTLNEKFPPPGGADSPVVTSLLQLCAVTIMVALLITVYGLLRSKGSVKDATA